MENSFLAGRKLLACTSILLSALFAMAHAIAGTILVTNALGSTVTLFDETTLNPITKLTVDYMPHEVVVTPNNKFALVSNFGDIVNVIPGETVSVIDIENAKVVQTIKLPKKSRPHGIAFISDTQALVTAQGIQSLLLLDIMSGNITKTIPLPGDGAHMVTVDAAKRYAYVASVDSGTVCKIDLKNDAIVGEAKIGKEAEGLTLTQDEGLLLVTNRKDNYVTVLRTKDLSILKNISTGFGPVRVVLASEGKSAVVINTISGNAQIIDLASLEITKSFKTTLSLNPLPVPINVLVRDDQRTAYVTNSFACNVTLVDLEKGEVLKTFSVSNMPDGIAFSHLVVKQ